MQRRPATSILGFVGRLSRWLGPVRLAVAAAAVAAIAYQFGKLDGQPGFSPANFFSFFTIQSNLLAICILGLTALVRPDERTAGFDCLRGAVTLYIAITGAVFALLLSGLQESLDTHTPWMDFVVHKLTPVVLVADWLVDPPRHRLPWRVALVWLCYPAAWFAYTLVRGSVVGWYPYPFVDVAAHGYGRVFLNALVLLVGFAAAALGFVALGNRRARPARQALGSRR
jgi:hypothetical protein